MSIKSRPEVAQNLTGLCQIMPPKSHVGKEGKPGDSQSYMMLHDGGPKTLNIGNDMK